MGGVVQSVWMLCIHLTYCTEKKSHPQYQVMVFRGKSSVCVLNLSSGFKNANN